MSEPFAPAQQAPSGALSFGMVAGEASGDLLAGLLIQGLQQRWPQAQAYINLINVYLLAKTPKIPLTLGIGLFRRPTT